MRPCGDVVRLPCAGVHCVHDDIEVAAEVAGDLRGVRRIGCVPFRVDVPDFIDVRAIVGERCDKGIDGERDFVVTEQPSQLRQCRCEEDKIADGIEPEQQDPPVHVRFAFRKSFMRNRIRILWEYTKKKKTPSW